MTLYSVTEQPGAEALLELVTFTAEDLVPLTTLSIVLHMHCNIKHNFSCSGEFRAGRALLHLADIINVTMLSIMNSCQPFIYQNDAYQWENLVNVLFSKELYG